MEIFRLAQDAEQTLFASNDEIDIVTKRSLFHSVIDTAVTKLTAYHDIALRTITSSKLRSGKVCRNNGKIRSRKIVQKGLIQGKST